MRGKKISPEQFIMNYTNVKQEEINTPIKPEPEQRIIYNAVILKFDTIVQTTEKGVLIRFEKDGADYWFPRSLSRINNRTKEVTLPKNLVEERQVLAEEADESQMNAPQSLTDFLKNKPNS